jgi:crotonobetainyl-CoA hydratase
VSDELLVRDEDAVRVLTLNRPHVLNAISTSLGAALHDALVAADAEAGVRCILLTATGERAFCAGGDLKQEVAADGPAPGNDSRVITDALRHRPGKPLLAAVNGLAYGGGFELLLACDLVVCAEHATFALPEVSRGRLATGGGLVRLPRLVGPRRALQLILTGAPIDAATALAWGLVNQVTPPGHEFDTALALARTIAANAPVALRLSKETVLDTMRATEAEAWQINDAAFSAVRRSPDAEEGLRAFAEGRAPVWTDLDQ